MIDTNTAQTAEIHFFSTCTNLTTCRAAFRGFEFESNFMRNNSPSTPASPKDIIFELRDPDPGSDQTDFTVNVLDGDPGFSLQGLIFNGGHNDVRSEDTGVGGGHDKVGVFIHEVYNVVAEAGATPLVYSAGTLDLTTVGGTETVTETVVAPVVNTRRMPPSSIDNPTRQADNDLGS